MSNEGFWDVRGRVIGLVDGWAAEQGELGRVEPDEALEEACFALVDCAFTAARRHLSAAFIECLCRYAVLARDVRSIGLREKDDPDERTLN